MLPDVAVTTKTFFDWGMYMQSFLLAGEKKKCASRVPWLLRDKRMIVIVFTTETW